MKFSKLMISLSGLLLVAALSNSALADPDSGWRMGGGYGPGMMGGGYGPGYGMMGGGYGPGMMGGGYGPGMMGGYGGMGYGMMGGYGFGDELGLSADQRNKLSQIRKAMREKQWPLMSDMMDAQEKLQELYDADKPDEAAINKQYKVLDDLRRKMIDNGLEASNKMDGVLTKEQREKMQKWGGRGYRNHMMW